MSTRSNELKVVECKCVESNELEVKKVLCVAKFVKHCMQRL